MMERNGPSSRFVLASVFILATGAAACGSQNNEESEVVTVKSTHQKLSADGTINSKDEPGKEVIVDTGIGVPGNNAPSQKDIGFCGFTAIGGRFGHEGDYIAIRPGSSGNWEVVAHAAASGYDGPRGDWACVLIKEFGPNDPPLDQWSTYQIGPSVVENPTNYQVIVPTGTQLPIDTTRANILTSLDGAMLSLFDAAHMEPDKFTVSHTVIVKDKFTCEEGVTCKLSSDVWSTGRSGLSFTYSIVDETVLGGVTLSSEQDTVCFLNGITGELDDTSNLALTRGHTDGLWHVASSGGVWGYATCIPYAQNW